MENSTLACTLKKIQMRDLNYFYSYSVSLVNSMREISQSDSKILIQFSRENDWHLSSK